MFVLCFWERLRNMSIYVINHLAWIGRWYSVILPLEELIKTQKIHVVQFPTCQNQHSSEWGVWMKVSTAITVTKTVELAMKKSTRSPSFGKIWYGCPITQSLNNQGFALLYLMCFYTNQGLIPFDSNKLLWELFKIPGWGESISTCQHAGEFCLLYLLIFTCFYTPCCILLHNWLKKICICPAALSYDDCWHTTEVLHEETKCSGLFMHIINFLRKKKRPGIKAFLNVLGMRKTKTNGQKLKPRRIQMRRF